MSNESWKRYGGVSKTDKYKNLTIGTIVADQVLLRQKVSTITEFPNSINVTTGDLNVLNGSLSGQNLTVNTNLKSKNAIIENYIKIGNDGTNNYVSLSQTTGGINIDTPILDICGNFILRSSSKTARNIITQNSDSKGIVVSVDANSNSYIDFFNSNPTSGIANSDAKISSLANTLQFGSSNIKINSGSNIDISSNNTGNIRTAGALKLISNTNIDVSANTLLNLISPNTTIYSRLHVTNRDSSSNLLNETMVIYDISAGRYLYDVYNNNTYSKGSALTLVSNDTVSNTFMNIITPNKLGLGIGGGSYIKDTAKSFGTIGVFNSENQYIPAQNIVSGNSKEKYYSTIGVNKSAPSTEKYVMDINGATRITNGEINKVQDVSFQILNVAFSKTEPSFGIAVGTPSAITSPYIQNIYYTNDGGMTWTQSTVDDDVLGSIAGSTFRDLYIYVHSSSYAVIAANNTNLLYTNNGGKNWTNYSTGNYINFDRIYSIYCTVYGEKKYVIITYENSSGIFVDSGDLIQNFQYISNTNQKTFIDGYSNYIYCVGNGIQKYQINTSSSSNPTLSSVYSTAVNTYTYKHINVFNNSYAIAVGNGIISYTKDGGNNWIDFTSTITNINLNMCYIYDTLRAVAVGENGKIYYTNDGYITWNEIPDALLNSGGNSNLLNGSGNSLKTIYMPNINSLVISKIVQTYNSTSTLGLSNIYYCYLPNLFNRSQNSVLDISGSSQIGGDLTITEGGNLIVNYDSSLKGNLFVIGDSSFSGSLYIANDATIIGNLNVTSKIINNADVTMKSSLFVDRDASIIGDVTIGQDLIVYGNFTVKQSQTENVINTTVNNYNLIISEDISLNGRLIASGDISLNSNLYISKNMNINTTNNITNALVNINGNMITNYVGINKTAVNTNRALDINGNIVQSNGCIFQF